MKQVGALAIEDSSLNDQANLVKELSCIHEVLVYDLKQDLAEIIKSNKVDAIMMIQQVPISTGTGTSTVTTDNLNSISTLPTLATILSNMKALGQEIHHLKTLNPQPSPPDCSINPCSSKPWKKYCRTCGCCPHSSQYCPVKTPGQQDDASFANQKGGNNKNC